MLFSSLTFLLFFLPFAVLGCHLLAEHGRAQWAFGFLLLASLIYYAWWKPENIWILFASICANFLIARRIADAIRPRKALLCAGLACNLAALCWFKYADFALANANSLLGTSLPLLETALPIGISFFTFQQIAYLVDVYRGAYDPRAENFRQYCLIVCFFPYIVAGPIVRHAEMGPQLTPAPAFQVNWQNIFNGLVLLSIGLAKKTLIADNLAPLVEYFFNSSKSLSFLEAFLAALAYALQLYFDFSGYSDMAVACALFFNIRLPWNFLSPYKATNIQDFWRRRHITLSLWLRDYLYIPLGGSRKGTRRTLINIFATFLLGGLWHGAAWTFVLWGAMHGAALALHRLWAGVWKKSMPRLCGWLLTFCFLNLAWTVFRAPDFACIKKFTDAFLGHNGLLPSNAFYDALRVYTLFPSLAVFLLFLAAALSLALFCKNSFELLAREKENSLCLSAVAYATLLASTMLVLLFSRMPNEFLYFQF